MNANNNSSFEQFTASCDDAWDHKIEDKISLYQGADKSSNSNPTSRLKYGARPAIHIKELVSIYTLYSLFISIFLIIFTGNQFPNQHCK